MEITAAPDEALTALRTARRRRRMQDVDVWEAFYRLYLLIAAFGAAAFVFANSIGDAPVDAAVLEDVVRLGPGIVGLVAAVAVGVGLRSGSFGGPLLVEAPDVHHVLLAPVSRRVSLRLPTRQVLRTAGFAGVFVGTMAGLQVAVKFPGGSLEWAVAGAVTGLTLAWGITGSAMLASGTRIRPRSANLVTAVVVGVSVLGLLWGGMGVPGTAFGHLALGPVTSEPIRWLAAAGAALLVVAGVGAAPRVSVEALHQRSSLASALRVAIWMNDLRMITLLRRRLTREGARHRPWIDVALPSRWPVVGRSLRGTLRWPASRIGKLVGLWAATALALWGFWSGAVALAPVAAVTLLAASLDATEPLGQLADAPDLRDSLPMARGSAELRHLAVPMAVNLLAGGIVFVGAAVLLPSSTMTELGLLTFVPAAVLGVCGAAVSTLHDTPLFDPGELGLPAEILGPIAMMRATFPAVVASMGLMPVYATKLALDLGEDAGEAAVSALVLAAVFAVGVLAWVRYRKAAR